MNKNYEFYWYYKKYEYSVKYNILDLLNLEIINNYFRK